MHRDEDISLLRIMTLIGSLTFNFTPAEFVDEFVFPRRFGKSLPMWALNLLKMHLNSVSRDKKFQGASKAQETADSARTFIYAIEN